MPLPAVEMAGFASPVPSTPVVEMAGIGSPVSSAPVVEMAGFANSKYRATVSRSIPAHGRSAGGTSLFRVTVNRCLHTHCEDVRHAPLVPDLRGPEELSSVPRSGWF
jgi:hypothetical protein